MEHTAYYVGLKGTTWEGFKGELELSFDSLPTAQMVKAKAGDFQAYEIAYATKVTTVETLEAFDVE